MSDSDLVITISGKAEDFNKALEDVRSKTEELNGKLEQLSLVSGAIFAASTAEIYESVKAYASQEAAANTLTQALITQGIYSDKLVEDHQKQAEAISAKTGIDAAAITQGQATAQGLLGQIAITEELTQAVVDFAAHEKMDVSTAFELVAKSAYGSTQMLHRHGIVVNETGTAEERLAQFTQVVSEKYDGYSASGARGLGSTKLLHVAFDELQKLIGKNFAPAITAGTAAITEFIRSISANKGLVDFIAMALAGTAAVAGFVSIASAAGVAFLALSSTVAALGLTFGAIALPLGLAVAAVAALGVGIGYLATHWNSAWPAMQAVFAAFTQSVGPIASALGKVLAGAFTLNPAMVKEGIAELAAIYKKGYDNVAKTVATAEKTVTANEKKELEIRAANQKEAADKAQAERVAIEARRLAAEKAARDLLKAENNNSSAAMVAIKKGEADTLAKIENEKYKTIRGDLQKHLKDLQMLEANQIKIDEAQKKKFNNDYTKNEKTFQQMSLQQQKIYLLQHQQQLQATIDTEEQAQAKFLENRQKQQIAADNQFLQDEIQFGTAYAAINQAMHSAIYTGTNQAFGELSQMTTSNNATLKRIGKIAAEEQIIMKTAQSAMNIYNGFSMIPIVGPALGIAGAAAAIAFGYEQLQKVAALNTGGVVPGGGPNQDSVMSFLTPGELVVPRNNFNETVNAVADSRNGGDSGKGGGGLSPADSAVLAKVNAHLDSIDQKFSAPSTTTTIQGDVLSDQIFVDALVRKISQAVQYRNVKLYTTPVGT